MSISKMLKVTFVGSTAERRDVLERLQDFGSLHIIPLSQDHLVARNAPTWAHEALQFLLSTPRKFQQVTRDQNFDAEKVARDALALRERLDALSIERDKLLTLIDERRPWGNFKPPGEHELRGRRLWLYRVPRHLWEDLQRSERFVKVVGTDNRFVYLAIISETEPSSIEIPVPPLSWDPRSMRELEATLEDLQIAIADLEVERYGLSRWCLLLHRNIDRLDDVALCNQVSRQTRDVNPLFALQAWVPEERLNELRKFAAKRAMVIEAVKPEPSEIPPTRFQNPEAVAGGEELVALYMTPSYWLFDPASVVFFSFALFFAMIVADAGYGLLLLLLTIAFWKRMHSTSVGRRWRLISAWIAGLSIIYGILVGSYFGMEPSSGLLKSLHVFDMKNYAQMMLLSALIGVAHIVLANLLNAWRYGRNPRGLAPVGWASMVLGGTAIALGLKTESTTATQLGMAALGLGVLLVVAFTAAGEPPGKRLIGGLLGLTKITSAFGDVLSYLRLFALGLASASLAAVFNAMAGRLHARSPGIGLLFALIVLLFGHAINFLLCVSSGFIHGLRLNVIEFFNWGVQEEGKAYCPFMRKENANWNR